MTGRDGHGVAAAPVLHGFGHPRQVLALSPSRRNMWISAFPVFAFFLSVLLSGMAAYPSGLSPHI